MEEKMYGDLIRARANTGMMSDYPKPKMPAHRLADFLPS